jgi:hypothetical protein
MGAEGVRGALEDRAEMAEQEGREDFLVSFKGRPFASLTQKFRIKVSGGQGANTGGPPGVGGDFGLGGPGGQEAKPNCNGGNGGLTVLKVSLVERACQEGRGVKNGADERT